MSTQLFDAFKLAGLSNSFAHKTRLAATLRKRQESVSKSDSPKESNPLADGGGLAKPENLDAPEL
jgi:hypothetical protein